MQSLIDELTGLDATYQSLRAAGTHHDDELMVRIRIRMDVIITELNKEN